jgi:hypothetical protein
MKCVTLVSLGFAVMPSLPADALAGDIQSGTSSGPSRATACADAIDAKNKDLKESISSASAGEMFHWVVKS